MKNKQAPYDFATSNLNGIDVIPSILIQGVINYWVAEDKSDLAPCHPGLELINHSLGDDVALLDSDAMHTRKSEG